MSLLVIRSAGTEERVFRIRGQRVAIGRDEAADLVLPGVAVSRLHACLETLGSSCEMVDQESTNGVKINGVKVARQHLEHGDVLRIGKYRLEYYDESKVDLFQVTRLSQLRSARGKGLHSNMSTMCLPPEALATAVEPYQQAVLVRLDEGGGRWKPGDGRISIGPGGDVPVAMELTSQPVAEVRWDGAHHILRACGWAHRVEVNGQRVREAALEPGASIQVGDARFEFIHVTDEAQAS
jgi:hypothetical protein